MNGELSPRSDDGAGAAARLPDFAEMLAYWRTKAAGRAAPLRAEVDPLPDLPRLAPDMLLWDVLDERGYICRLAGTRICAVGGRELRGVALEDMPWEVSRLARQEFDRVAEALVPHFVERRMAAPIQGLVRYRRLLLPLAGKDRRASMIWSLVTLD